MLLKTLPARSGISVEVHAERYQQLQAQLMVLLLMWGVETNDMSGEELAEYGLKSFSVRTAVNFVSNGLGSGKMTAPKALGLFSAGLIGQSILNIGSTETDQVKGAKSLYGGLANLGGAATMNALIKSNNLPRQQPSIGFNIVGGSLVAMAFSSPVLVYTAWVKSREAKERRK